MNNMRKGKQNCKEEGYILKMDYEVNVGVILE